MQDQKLGDYCIMEAVGRIFWRKDVLAVASKLGR